MPHVETADRIAPTPERRRHGRVEDFDHAIADETGAVARPYRAVDTIAIMERRGTITPAMRQAGEDFRAAFAAARLDPLGCQDLGRPWVDNAPHAVPTSRIIAAREQIWQAVKVVGGIVSPAGSCLWHVVGWEQSLKEWALTQGWNGRRVSQEAASGILIAALGALAEHFGLKEPPREKAKTSARF